MGTTQRRPRHTTDDDHDAAAEDTDEDGNAALTIAALVAGLPGTVLGGAALVRQRRQT